MLGLGDMLDEVVKYFPEYKKDDEEDDRPKIAIIGKPNVGKSSSSINWRRRTASLYRISQVQPEMQLILILSTMEKNMCLLIPQD